jgi:beta-phosphoglucomutase family hydrolase
MSQRIDWSDFDAVLFDLDGVITPTAEVHERAWAELFRDYGFTQADYLTYVDGKPRYDGVRSFLHSKGVDLPEGNPSDAPGDDTVCAMGNKKNELFNDVLQRDGIAPYPGTVKLLDMLDRLGTRQAIVSSSKNARTVLEAAGMADRFDVIVDGLRAVDEQLPGKPAPDMFVRAAELVGTSPARSAVVEDAVSGVQAGRAGGFALVLGVDRGGHADTLRASGAHVVVPDLGVTIEPDGDAEGATG